MSEKNNQTNESGSRKAGAGASKKPLPERFVVGRSTLVVDYLMNHGVKIGGIGVIAAIAGIFVFLFMQVLPLFKSAKIEYERTIDLGEVEIGGMGVDPWAELPVFVSPAGVIHFLDIADMGEEANRGMFQIEPEFPEGLEFPYIRFDQDRSTVLFGTADGRFAAVKIDFEQTHPEHRSREVVPTVSGGTLFEIGDGELGFEQIDYVDAGTRKLAVALQIDEEGNPRLYAVTFSQTQPLVGAPVTKRENEYELTELYEGDAEFLRLSGDGDFVFVGTEDGIVHLIARESDGFDRRQTIHPFEGRADESIFSMDLLSGGQSLIFTNPMGESMMYSIVHSEERGERALFLTKEMEVMANGQGATYYSNSQRNKAYLIGNESHATLRYATTESVRWEENFDYKVVDAMLSPRYNRIMLVDDENQMHIYTVEDRHPEASWRAYFGKIHYEGRSEPEFMWQSDGAEPKISMVPLIWGTLKGTVFAMMIAVPVALLAALYTSQFLKPEVRRVIKPVMEIMESVPTVVLGFLAALWLAPIISGRIPSVFLVACSLPIGGIMVGLLAAHLPLSFKRWIKAGYEFLYIAPMLFLLAYLAWIFGPVLEGWVFTVENPETGERIGNFPAWWTETFGADYRNRNALIVGLFMGFAIIPTIFTIAEDAMNSVPSSFRSGALALGASRWQTTLSVILPTAAAGIFSAVMIGFGRAVGETMILLMATGNTPIMTMNMFDGMRTLAANIAVELPEAAQGGTLYRSLFLGAILLFGFTFFINSIAELMRQRLRERYKAVE